ncbi:MAG: tetratricopeptide repeat protein, partial [Chitinivibrionales bacterium]|nr:tetratricopeptide repeat protein [Chitinivibrionales bacterium]
ARHYDIASSKDSDKSKAIESYSRIVTRFPSSEFAPEAWMGLAGNYFELREYDQAIKAADNYLNNFAASEYTPHLLYIKGMATRNMGNYQGALEIFKNVVYGYPFSSYANRARFELATAQLQTGKILEAYSNYQSFIQSYPSSKNIHEARYGIARCLIRMGKKDEAVAILNDLLDEKLAEAAAAGVHYELASIAENNGEIYAAIQHYKKVLSSKEYSRKESVFLHVGGLYFQNRIYSDAAEAYEKAFELADSEKDSLAALKGSIIALIMDGKQNRADKKFDLYKKRFASDITGMVEIIYHEGLHFQNIKKYDKAVNRFNHVVGKYDKSERVDDAAYQIALSHYFDNNKEKSLDLFRSFIQKYPTSEFVPLARFKVAMIYHGQDEFALAAREFSTVAANEKTDKETRFRSAHNAAIDYQRVAGWMDAAGMYRMILKEYPDDVQESNMHLKIGFCLVQASRFEEALIHFQKAGKNPNKEDKPEILYWIATCHAKLGEYRNAIAEYLKVPYLYSGIGKWGITGELEAARLYERLGEYDKARSLYKKIVRSDGQHGRFGKDASERLARLENLTEEK